MPLPKLESQEPPGPPGEEEEQGDTAACLLICRNKTLVPALRGAPEKEPKDPVFLQFLGLRE